MTDKKEKLDIREITNNFNITQARKIFQEDIEKFINYKFDNSHFIGGQGNKNELLCDVHNLKNYIKNIKMDTVPYSMIINANTRLYDFAEKCINNKIQNNYSNHLSLIFKEFIPIISFLYTEQKRIEELDKNFNDLKNKVNQVYKESKENITYINKNKISLESVHQKCENIYKKCESISSYQGVEKYQNKYETKARKHKRTAIIWLVLIIIFCICLVGIPIYTLIMEKFFQNLLYYIPILSTYVISTTLVIWFSKQYRINKHNEEINMNKSLVLETYDTLIKAGISQETRDTILVQTVTYIFGKQDTGYQNTKNDVDINFPIFELLNNTKNKN